MVGSGEQETLINTNCKPFYSPREFSSVVLLGVYIPPDASPTKAVNQLTANAVAVESAHPDNVIIIRHPAHCPSVHSIVPL